MDIVLRPRGFSYRGLSPRLVPLAEVNVGAAGALMAPVRCRGCRMALPQLAWSAMIHAIDLSFDAITRALHC